MRDSPMGWGEKLASYIGVGLLTTACATPVSLVDGRWRASEDGASLADLAALEIGWRRIEPAEGDIPLLAFRGPDDARACWIHQCRDAAAPARAEAHALLIALDEVVVEEEGAVTLGGAPGWALRAQGSSRGRAVTLKAVTRVADGCTDDFVLVTHEALAPLEPAFDRWWASFEPGSRG